MLGMIEGQWQRGRSARKHIEDILVWCSKDTKDVVMTAEANETKCLHCRAPVYLSGLCVLTVSVSGRCRLRSADDKQLLVSRTQTVTFCPRAFSTSGPDAVVWATSFTRLSGLFQTFTQDFSVPFVDLVFLSSRVTVWRFSLTARF